MKPHSGRPQADDLGPTSKMISHLCLLAGVQVSQQVWGHCIAQEQVCFHGCHHAFSTLDPCRPQAQCWGRVAGSPAEAKALCEPSWPILTRGSSVSTSALPPWRAPVVSGPLQFGQQWEGQGRWLGGLGSWPCPRLSSAPPLCTSSCHIRASCWLRIAFHLTQNFPPVNWLRVMAQKCS